MAAKIQKTDEEWQSQLSDLAYKVTRKHATERPVGNKHGVSILSGKHRMSVHGDARWRASPKFGDSRCGVEVVVRTFPTS